MEKLFQNCKNFFYFTSEALVIPEILTFLYFFFLTLSVFLLEKLKRTEN